jgi:Family of unknown function (DUF6529)
MGGLSSELSPRPTRRSRWLLVPLVLGAVVSLTAGLVARQEAIAPGSYPGGYLRLFFSDTLHLKVWLTTTALALAVVQLLSAAWIFNKLPWPRPGWVAGFHRWTGRFILALAVPVGYHCIFKLGFQRTDTRVLIHSFVGCAVVGAFTAKILIVRLHRFPSWVLPVAGGLLFALLLAAWYTSALWLLSTKGVAV